MGLVIVVDLTIRERLHRESPSSSQPCLGREPKQTLWRFIIFSKGGWKVGKMQGNDPLGREGRGANWGGTLRLSALGGNPLNCVLSVQSEMKLLGVRF